MRNWSKKILFVLLTAIICLTGMKVRAAVKVAAPTISASNVASSGKIKITWSAVDGAAKYKLYRSKSKTGTYTLMKTVTTTSHVNESAKAGEMYYYYVCAIDSKGNISGKSNIVSRTCDLARPTITRGNVASTGKIKISWKAIEGAKEYKVYRSNTKNGTYALMKTTTSTSFVNTSAVAGKTYYYKVKAIASNSAANSAFSTALSRTCDCARPVVTLTKDLNGKPIVSWKAVEGATSYEVYRTVNPNGNYTLLKTTKNTKFTNPGAGSGVTYYYKVRALANSSAATSAYSAVKSITTSAPKDEVFTKAYVASVSARIYPIPSDSSEDTVLVYMTEVQLGSAVSTTASGSWNRVKYNGQIYYTWIPTGVDRFTETKSSFAYTANTETRQAVIDLAMKIHKEWDTVYLHDQSNGIPNADGTYGFDCSGFVSYVLNTVMQEIVPSYKAVKSITKLYETEVLYNPGVANECKVEEVALKNIQPGDILFFNIYGGAVDHCAIYLGNNEFIHSSEFWNGVCILPLEGTYKEQFVAARRFVPDNFVPANVEMYAIDKGAWLCSNRDMSSETRLHTFVKDEKVLLLYKTSDGLLGYVRASDNREGFVRMKRFDLL